MLKQDAYDDAGVMPIMTYGGFKRMTGFCKTHVPKDVEDALESIKDNDEAVKNFGIDLGTRMCKRILETGTPGLHMYTLNTERSSVAILENLGLINKSQVSHSVAGPSQCLVSLPCFSSSMFAGFSHTQSFRQHLKRYHAASNSLFGQHMSVSPAA